MGTFAETAIVDYCRPIAYQGKQTSVFCFRLQQTKESLPFPFSICSKQIEAAVLRKLRFTFAEFRKHGYMETWKYGVKELKTWKHGDIDIETWRHGNMETWRTGDMETWTHGHMDTWTHGHMDTWTHGHVEHGHMDTWTHEDRNI